MKPKLSLRIAAFFIFFVAVGHTLGHYTRKIGADAGSRDVLKHMEQYKFNFNGATRSWDNLYEGLSLDVSLTLFVLTVVYGLLANACKKYPELCYKLLWVFLVCFVGFTIIGFRNFFLVPAITTLLVCVFTVMAMMKLRRRPKYDSELAQST